MQLYCMQLMSLHALQVIKRGHLCPLKFKEEEKMIFKKSPFLHIFPVSNKYLAFYNSLSLELAFLEKDTIEKCMGYERFFPVDSESETILKSLEKIGLIIPEESDGMDIYRFYKKKLEKPAINILYLLITDACNLRCGYCYFLSNMEKNYKFSQMEESTAVKAIEMFSRCIKKSIAEGHKEQHIVLYGGEPTTNKKTLVASLRFISSSKNNGSLPSDIGVTINTNGILLDGEIIEEAKRSNAIIAISIDGPKDIHNQMRVDISGKGSFDRVIQSYYLATSLGAKVGICVTIDRHNLYEAQNIINWLADTLKVKGLGFNILIENETSNPNNYLHYSQEVAIQLVNCYRVAREKGVYEDRIMRRVKNFIEKTPVLSDCGGCGLQIVVSPDGQIGVCQAFCGSKKYFVSESMESFEPTEHQFWKEWRNRSPLSMEECKSCIALGNCGGGCPYNAYKIKGSINALDERFCMHAKTTVEFLIKDLWEKQKQEGI